MRSSALSLLHTLPLLSLLCPLLLLCGPCGGIGTAAAASAEGSTDQWSLQQSYEDKVGDSVAMTGQGMVYLATSDAFNEIVNIYASYQTSNGTTFGQVGLLSSKASGFGKILDFYDDDESFEKTLFVGQSDDDRDGRTFIYSGSWNQWTMTQILSPPPQFSHSGFSSMMRSDRNTSTLAVGCPFCNVTTYAGQVYLYQQDPSHLWINTQVLNAKYVNYLQDPKSAAFFLGGFISLDRNVLLTSVLTYRNGNDFIWGMMIFTHSTSTGKWSQQQTITSAIYDATTMTVVEKNIDVFAVHDETIVFSTVGQPHQGIDGVGAVSILYPNTKRFTAPYTPSPTILTSLKSVHTADTLSSGSSDHNHLRSSANSKEDFLTAEYLQMKLSQANYLSPKARKRKSLEDHSSRPERKRHSLILDDHVHSVIQEKLGFPISQNIETHSRESLRNLEESTIPSGATESNFPQSQTYSTSSSKLTSRGLSWSTRQILYPPAPPTAQSNFGSDLSIYRNTLIIGEQGTSRIYYYSRPEKGHSSTIGLWSHQQTLLPTRDNVLFYSDSYLSNSYLMTLGLVSVPQLSLISMDFRINNQDWKCLLISLEDTFGDGWGSDVYLTLMTPLGRKFPYTMAMTSFDTPNPFVIRYCPDEAEYDYFVSSSSSPRTTYLIRIERGNESNTNLGPFFWEVQYRTQIERDETVPQVVYGNYGTKVRYTFNWETKSFEYLSSSRPLPSPTSSCESCRVYSQSDIHSSALLSDLSNWRYLKMITNSPSVPWYNQQDPYHSTNYYLSDIFGSKLIYSGTMCSENGVIHSCWLDIPSDGTYLLRISGALYTNSTHANLSPLSSSSSSSSSLSVSSHSWNFCSQSGSANSHIYFTVFNSGLDCVINGIFPLETYKSSDLQSFIFIDGIFTITKTKSIDESHTLLSAADRSLFSQAITSVLWNISPRDITVQQEVYLPSPLLNDIKFTVILNMKTSSSTSLWLEEEYEHMKVRDYFYMKSLGEEIIEKIDEGVMDNKILRVLQSNILVPNSNFFRTAVSVTIKEDLKMREDITLIPAAPSKDQVSFF